VSDPERPLAGRRILVTRRAAQASTLGERLRALGAVIVECGAIEIEPPEDTGPLDRALRALHRYHWLLLTSANAVSALAGRLAVLGLDPAAALAGVRVAVVGPATGEAFRERFLGRQPDAQPAGDYRAEGLLAALPAEVAGLAFLLPSSDRARDVLPRTLAARGAAVDVVVAYRTVAAPELAARLEEAFAAGLDLATFASPSAVESFVAAAGERSRAVPAAAIGPVTAEAAAAAGLDVRVVARPSTVEGLVAGLVAYFEAGGAGKSGTDARLTRGR
jgi:uroporphyrinogen-III synthase